MKKIAKGIRLELPAVKFCLEEVEYVYHKFEEVKPSRIEAQLGDYCIEELTEMKSLPVKRVSTFSIRIYEPFYCHFEAGESSTRISSSSEDLLVKGLVDSLRDISLENTSWFRKARSHQSYGWIVGVLLGILSVVTAVLFSILIYKYFQIDPTFLFPLSTLIFLFLFYKSSNLLDSRAKGVFLLEKKEEVPSFMRRNRDQIILIFWAGLISSIITLIITLIVNKLISK